MSAAGILVLLASVLHVAQEVRVLDLTGVKETPARVQPNTGTGGGGGIGGNGNKPRPVLEVKILPASTTESPCDGRGIFEILVKNVSEGVLRLPSGIHRSDVEPEGDFTSYSFEKLLITLRVDATAEPTRYVGVKTLFGSPDRQGTMTRLQPGEWIRIRAQLPTASIEGKAPTTGSPAGQRFASAVVQHSNITIEKHGSGYHSRWAAGTLPSVESVNRIPLCPA